MLSQVIWIPAHKPLGPCISQPKKFKVNLLLSDFILKIPLFLGAMASQENFPLFVCFCSGVAVCMTSPLFSCPSLSGVLPHLLFLQNLPSVVVGHVLDPQPSEIILDMCAAPGDILLQSLPIF